MNFYITCFEKDFSKVKKILNENKDKFLQYKQNESKNNIVTFEMNVKYLDTNIIDLFNKINTYWSIGELNKKEIIS